MMRSISRCRRQGSVNPCKPEFTIVIYTHYKPRIAVAISRLVVGEDDLKSLSDIWKKVFVIIKTFSHENRSKTTTT